MKNQFERINDITEQHLKKIFGENKFFGALKQLILENTDTQKAFQNMSAEIFDNKDIKYKISGIENLPKEGAFLVGPNHPRVKNGHKILFKNTYSLPYHMFFLDKVLQNEGISNSFITSAGKGMLYSMVLKLLGFYGLKKDRNGRVSLKEKQKLNKWIETQINKSEINSRVAITIFPEGRQNGIGNFGKLNKGIFYISQKKGIPIIPVRMDGFDENREEYKDVKIHFGENFFIDPKESLNPEFIEKIRKRVYGENLGLNLVEGR